VVEQCIMSAGAVQVLRCVIDRAGQAMSSGEPLTITVSMASLYSLQKHEGRGEAKHKKHISVHTI
jgi:hypothetical protein